MVVVVVVVVVGGGGGGGRGGGGGGGVSGGDVVAAAVVGSGGDDSRSANFSPEHAKMDKEALFWWETRLAIFAVPRTDRRCCCYC